GQCYATIDVTLNPPTISGVGCSFATGPTPSGVPANNHFPVGTTIVMWDYTTSDGTTGQCLQVVQVDDCQNPTITCPGAITQCLNDINGNLVDIGTPTVWDNCPLPDGAVTNNAPARFPVGTTNVTWTVMDAAGHTATCTQVVTINSSSVTVHKFYDANRDGMD